MHNADRMFFKRFFSFFVSTACLQIHAALPHLSSDKPIVYDLKKKCSVAEKNAELDYKDLCLKADKIYYFAEDPKLEAEKDVQLTQKQIRFLTPKGEYQLQNQGIAAETYKLEFNGHGIEGKNLHGTLNHLQSEDTHVYINGKQRLGLNFHAQSSEIYPNDAIELYNVIGYIGDVPLFYSPYYRYSLKKSVLRWKSDFGMVRRNKDLGRYWRNEFRWDTNKPFKPGIMLDYYRKRSALFGGILEYQKDEGTHGYIKIAKIHDNDASAHKGNDGKVLDASRYFIDSQYQQHFNDRLNFVTQVRWLKDSDVIKDFRPDDHDGTRQHPDNFAELAYRSDDTVTSITTRYRFNHFQRIQERLPEIRFAHLPVEWKNSNVFYQWGLGFGALRERPLVQDGDANDLNTKRFDYYVEVEKPITIANNVVFTPLASGRVLHYFWQSNNHADFTRFLGQIGWDLRTSFYGDYNYHNDYWDIHGLRHIVSPVVQYRYLPKGQSGKNNIAAIDRESTTLRDSLRDLELVSKRDVDNFNDMHLFRLGLENYWYANIYDNNSRHWMHCNIYQDFRLRKNENEKRLSDLFLDFGWDPAKFFGYQCDARYNFQTKILSEINNSIFFQENDSWAFSLKHTYLRNSTNQIGLGFSYRLSQTDTLSASIQLDAHKPDLIKQTYTWSTFVANTWKVDWQFIWEKRKLADKQSGKQSWSLRILVQLLHY